VEFDVVAYPGVNLVIPTEEEKEAGNPVGIKEAFFWVSVPNIDTKPSMIIDYRRSIRNLSGTKKCSLPIFVLTPFSFVLVRCCSSTTSCLNFILFV
jgi:hypothetical protein